MQQQGDQRSQSKRLYSMQTPSSASGYSRIGKYRSIHSRVSQTLLNYRRRLNTARYRRYSVHCNYDSIAQFYEWEIYFLDHEALNLNLYYS